MNNMKEQVLLQNIFKYLNNLNYLNLNNELCLLYQGLIEPIDYDFERICRDLGKRKEIFKTGISCCCLKNKQD